MFSATRLAGIAAAMALFSAFWLVAPLDPPEVVPTPAAPATGPGEIAGFAGQVIVLDQDVMADAEHFDWGAVKLGERWTMRWEMSDPRISGTTTLIANVHEVGPEKRRVLGHTGRLFTQEVEGTWLEAGTTYPDPDTTGMQMQIHSVGEGAYEGLSALASCHLKAYTSSFDCEGVIFTGSVPEPPSEPPAQIPAEYAAP